jgi:hypothetical protein
MTDDSPTPPQDALREAALRIMNYRAHLSECEYWRTDFCTCGMREAAEAVRVALAVQATREEQGAQRNAPETLRCIRSVIRQLEGIAGGHPEPENQLGGKEGGK